jgi:oxygen-dependent protoporphyrinogen oxidase
MRDVVVIGAGISGLAAAWRLAQAGHDAMVLEARSTAGGNIKSVQQDGFTLDMGPQSFLATSDALWELIEEAGLSANVQASQAAAGNRYVYRDGRLHALPMSPASFFSSKLLSAKGKLRLVAEPVIRGGAREDDTAWDFFVRRFGEEAATYMMGPFVSGIYAGDAKMLGAHAAFPKFHNFERDSGSMIIGALRYKLAQKRAGHTHSGRKGLYSYTGGLGGLTQDLAAKLPDVRTEVRVRAVSRRGATLRVHTDQELIEARGVISAVPPTAAGSLFEELAREVPQLLAAVPLAPVMVVHWSQPESIALPSGFGFLMPRHYGLNVLGTVFARSCSRTAHRRASGCLLHSMAA